MQLTKPARSSGGPTRRGHDFKARRHRGKHRLVSDRTVQSNDCAAAPSAVRVWCPVCEKCHSIAVNYQHEYRLDGVPCVVKRISFCDGCEMVIWWDQSCDGRGEPFGRPLKGSLVTNNKQNAVERVLKIYPQLRGVQQV